MLGCQQPHATIHLNLKLSLHVRDLLAVIYEPDTPKIAFLMSYGEWTVVSDLELITEINKVRGKARKT